MLNIIHLLLLHNIINNNIINDNNLNHNIKSKNINNDKYNDNIPTYIGVGAESIENIAINMKKKTILDILENNAISIYVKLLVIEMYTGICDTKISASNLRKGNLMKDCDFDC
jgi:hypothetical protein